MAITVSTIHDRHIQFLLLTAVTLHKGATNPEVANTEALILGETQGWVPASLESRFLYLINT